jgi:hypothetical protein
MRQRFGGRAEDEMIYVSSIPCLLLASYDIVNPIWIFNDLFEEITDPYSFYESK